MPVSRKPKSPTLLITDDDHSLRESLGMVFSRGGFRTLLAEDGKQACELVRDTNVHLVILDFQMPRMTGLEALKVIRKINQKLPVILMSADMDCQLAEQAAAADVFAIHSKPLDLKLIRSDVSTAIKTIYDWTVA